MLTANHVLVRVYVRNQHLDKATGANFNEKGHHLSDMRITILEQVSNPDPFFRKQREHMYINLYSAKSKGLNSLMKILLF